MAAVHESLNAEMQELISSGEIGENYGEGENKTEWHDALRATLDLWCQSQCIATG